MALQRFIDAQYSTYARALSEINAGWKQSHWMWFIFPQLTGLGKSETASYYGIKDLREAQEYLSHFLLGHRLMEISKAVLAIEGKTANQVFGSPDDLKLQSCMTLFKSVEGSDGIFAAVLEKYFNGLVDERTVNATK